MTPNELWDIFQDAYENCPQARDVFDDPDSAELYNGSLLNYRKLRKSFGGVIGYWLNPDTIGGSTLMESGYINAAPVEIQEQVAEYQKELEKASTEIAKRIFT